MNKNRALIKAISRIAKKTIATIALSFIATVSIQLSNSSTVIAGSTQQQFTVSTAVISNCSLTQVNSLNFGTYDGNGANRTTPLDMDSTFSIRCTKGTTAVIGLNNGLNQAQATGTTRAMKNNVVNDYLNYELYRNAARTSVWNTTSNTISYIATTNAATNISVYGRIPVRQNTSSGVFSDTITIIANF